MSKAFLTLAAASVLLVGLPALTLPHALAASATVAVIPANHWAYQDLSTLQKAGIVIEYPGEFSTDRTSLTRYQFAEAVGRLLPLLQPNRSTSSTRDSLAATKADLQSKIDSTVGAIAALKELVKGFTPELTALGQAVPAANSRLDALQERIDALEYENSEEHFPATLVSSATVPECDWAYNAMDTLQKAGIVFGHPEGTYSGPPTMTRYEFAEATASLLPLIPTTAYGVQNKAGMPAASVDLLNKMDANPEVTDALKMLVDGFAPELTALGQDVHTAKFRLNSLEAREAARYTIVSRMRVKVDGHNMTIQNGTIPDLPVNQWVYQNIDTLQKAGIAIGYPDSTHSGKQDLPISWLAKKLLLLLQLQRPVLMTLPGKGKSPDSGADLERKLVSSPDTVRCLMELVDADEWIEEPRMDLLADKTHLGILRAQAIAFEEERYKEHITRGGTSRERTGNSTDVSSLAPSPLLKSEIPVEYNGADNTILPRNHWAYHAIDTLQHAGIVIANVGTYDGNSMSPNEIALALARVLLLLDPDTPSSTKTDGLADARTDLVNKLNASSESIDALKQLARGFEPQLTSLGQDVPAAIARLDSLELRYHALKAEISRVRLSPNGLNLIGSDGQFPHFIAPTFPNVPANQWAYQAVAILQKAGFNIGFDSPISIPCSLTRDQISSSLSVILPLLWNDEYSATGKDSLGPVDPYLQSKLDSNPDLLEALKTLVDGFAPDLASLGVSLPLVRARLGVLLFNKTLNNKLHVSS